MIRYDDNAVVKNLSFMIIYLYSDEMCFKLFIAGIVGNAVSLTIAPYCFHASFVVHNKETNTAAD